MNEQIKMVVQRYWFGFQNNIFVKNIISIIISGGFLYVLTFGNSVIIARILGPEGQGTASYANTISGVFVHFGGFGLDIATKYYVSKDKSNLAPAVGNTLLFFVTYILIGMVALLYIIFGHTSINFPIVLVALIIFRIPLDIAYSQFQNELLALTKVKIYNRARIVAGILYPVQVLIYTLLGVVSPVIVLFAAFVANLFGALIVFVSLLKYSGRKIKINIVLLKEMLPYGIKQYVGGVFNYLLLRCDILMIEHFEGKHQTGIYSLAASLADVLLMIAGSVSLVLTTKLIELPNEAQRFRFENRIIHHVSLIVASATMAAGVLSGWGIHFVYGAEYNESALIFRVLMPGVFFWGLNSLLSCYLSAVNKLNVTIVASIVAFFVNIILNFFLIQKYGILGAAVSSIIAYFIDACIRGIYYRHLLLKYRRSNKVE